MRQHYEDYLRAVAIFRACTRKELVEIGRLAERCDVESGEVLVKEGTRTKEFYLLLDGKAEVTRDGILLAVLGPGQYFGELALLDPAPRNATVTMTSAGQVLVLGQLEFATLLRDIPALTSQVLKGLARRIHELDPSPVH
jgi:CRP/FNR family transcriptional regulator, cyclic AMP receptor protein